MFYYKLTEIDFEVFSKLTKLSHLNLNSNKLKSLTDKNQTLTSLESLESMDLSWNQLALVKFEHFKGSYAAENIDIKK